MFLRVPEIRTDAFLALDWKIQAFFSNFCLKNAAIWISSLSQKKIVSVGSIHEFLNVLLDFLTKDHYSVGC